MQSNWLLSLIALFSLSAKAQVPDTVFMSAKPKFENLSDYRTDTIIFHSDMERNILIGTTFLPYSENQMYARAYGLQLKKMEKSDCQKDEEFSYKYRDKYNAIVLKDTSLVVDLNIYENCCYDFICDIAIDKMEDGSHVLNLIYYGYGVHCACDCCFGLVYHFKLGAYGRKSDFEAVKYVMINGDKKTLRAIRD